MSVIATRTRQIRNWVRLVLGVGLLGAGAATVAITFAPNLALTLPLMVAMGTGMGLFFIGQSTLVQRRVPDRLVGRVFAAVDAVGSCAFILGTAASAVIIDGLGVRGSYAISGLLLVLAASSVARLGQASSRRRRITRADVRVGPTSARQPPVDTAA